MQVQHDQFVTLYHFPSGRSTFAVTESRAAAAALGEAAIVALCDEVLAQAEVTRGFEVRHRLAVTGTPLYGPEANALDVLIDRALTALRGAVAARAAIVDGDGGGDPAAHAAKRLDDELFPRGVGFITSLNYVEEHAWVDTVVGRLRPAGDLAAESGLLGLEPFVARLDELNGRFGEELRKVRPAAAVTFDVIRAERAKLHRALVRLVVATLGRFLEDEEVAARTQILRPLLVQQERLAALYRSRRGVRDVNPATGEEDSVEVLEGPA